MPSHPYRRCSRLARPVLFTMTAIVVLAAACGGTPPSAPALVDPREILTAAATQAAGATSVHIDLAADGALAIDLTGTGSASTPIKLTDTTAAIDADLALGATRATFSAPGLLGVRGEAIVVDGVSYLKTSLTGPLYRAQSVSGAVDPRTSAAPSSSVVPGSSGSTSASILDGAIALLREPGVEPTKNPDASCSGTTCYSVTLEVGADQLARLFGGVTLPASLPIPTPDLSAATAELTFLVDRQTTHLSGLHVFADLGDTGEITADLTFSKWDAGVTIAAPPADQLQPGP